MSDDQIRPDQNPALHLRQKSWRSTFESFGIVNFRWFLGALCSDYASMNIQMFIRGWLVFEITDSYEKLGWMTAAGGVVGLFCAPLGGVLADRVRQKKHVLQLGSSANACVTLGMAYFIIVDALSFYHLLTAAVLQGIIMNIMMPSRQALTKDVVGLDLLTNAIGLSTSGMNTSRLLLPGLAGGLLSALGGGYGNIDPAKWVYILITVFYLVSALLLFKVMVSDRAETAMSKESLLSQISDGFAYVFRTPVIFMLLGCNFVIVFFSMAYFMLLPGFVKDVLDGGPDRLGLMISVSGVGSLLCSLIIANLSNRHRARVLLNGSLLVGLSLLLFSLSTNYWLSLFLLFITGFGQAARMSISNVLIQTYVGDSYRGRVMSIYMLEMSILSISVYPVSVLADYVGPQWAVGASAICLIIFVSSLFAVPVYRDLH